MMSTLLCLLNKRTAQQADYPWPTDGFGDSPLGDLGLELA